MGFELKRIIHHGVSLPAQKKMFQMLDTNVRSCRDGEADQREEFRMAKNGPKGGGREGAVSRRSQTKSGNGNWVKRDTTSGRFMDQKTSSSAPFKGVRKEK